MGSITREAAANEFTENYLKNNLFTTEPPEQKSNWDRMFFEELSKKIYELSLFQNSLENKEKLLEIVKISNEAKTYYSLGESERKLFEAKMIEERGKLEMKIYDEEFERKNHILELERRELSMQNKSIEFTEKEFELLRKEIELSQSQLAFEYTRLSTDLKEQSLSMKEFALMKDLEYKQFEITQKESIVKIGEMINFNEAKNLQGERQKIEVAQKLAEIGMQVREQNQQLQKQLNDIEKYNIRNEQQLLEINKGKADIQNLLSQAKNEYQKNQNEIREKLIEIKDIKFQNEVSSILLELNKKHFENDIQLQNLGLVQRENEAMLKGRENDIRSIYLTNQSVVNNLLSLQKENRLLAQIEAERQSHYNLEQNLQSRIWSLQNSLERSQIELTSERALKKYLQQ